MTHARTRTLLLTLDGVVHSSDLPVQAFARHITDQLAADQITPVIAGMRGFLEARPELIPPGIDLEPAEDGDQAVEILARAAGLPPEQITRARLASRHDLATSAWAVDETDGLAALIDAAAAAGARIAILAEPGDPAPAAVLDALDIDMEIVDHLEHLEKIEKIKPNEPNDDPARVLVIGAAWTGPLAAAHESGCATALVDRYRHGRGTPTFRSADLSGLLDPVGGWLEADPPPDHRPTKGLPR